MFLALAVTTTLLAWRRSHGRMRRQEQYRLLLGGLGFPAVVSAAIWFLSPVVLPAWVDAVLAAMLVIPLAGQIYRLVFEPLGNASILVLLIAAVGTHLVLMGVALLAFGPEGARGAALFSGRVSIAGVAFTGQQIGVLAFSIVVLVAMHVFFGRSYLGMVLRATAVNRLGAKLVGIPTEVSGTTAFCISGVVASVCGVLIASMTTIFYDTGFIIALKGFVVAVLGGLVSYPLAMVSALFLGLIEAATSFHWSQFKDAITYALILPALLLRSFTAHQEHEE
ncbi:branched-chain amino acid ABC transporter permease [Sinorhizobium saheli]|uniref:ABC transporter permease n=1 Tax=Sinorhizobium saheli TaxID=36856 RepID=A0A178YKE6_SINSA|nr:branched-chain amino acid ABC transporter permease [Sinorhizobium saheli]MQW86937.1 branched-chain amino acid ABC transporter permease [Sinorhizobium saheli]OAP47960.1 hypothetical protein ATB98_00945 [Sinorhizobium saheli]